MAQQGQEAAPETVLRSSGAGISVPPATMRRIAFASLIGTMIEFYDFDVYGVSAALVFGKVFFPALGAAAGTIAAFATLGAAFVARPLGGIIFGHFGDRVGRKTTLVTTLLVMGIATVLVGLMPTTGEIGVAAPIILVVLRIVQGLASGGEWAGAALFTAENAPTARRGFWAMFTPLGGGCALVLANGTFLLAGLGMSDAQFADYGWRIPFLASILLVGVGLYVRLKIDETPVFTKEMNQGGASRAPLAEVFRRQPRALLLAAGVPIMEATFVYVGLTYLADYGTTALHLSRLDVLAIGVLGGVGWAIGAVVGGAVSDRLGRRWVIAGASAAAVLWGLALFPVLGGGSLLCFGIGVCVTILLAGIQIGPLGAFMSELFHTRYRYTATGFSYNIALLIGGAIPPIVGAAITARFGGLVFGAFLALLSLVSVVCTLLLKETRGAALDGASDGS